MIYSFLNNFRKQGWNILIFTLFSIQNILAQSYNFRNFNVDDGLAQSQIQAIAQDNDGNLWMGTYGGGLMRFDGYRFENFTTKEGLVDNNVSSIYIDSRGHVWIGTGEGLCRYIPPRNLSVRIIGSKTLPSKGYFIKYFSEDGLVGKDIYSICEDLQGNIWVGTRNGISLLKKEIILETEFSDYVNKDKKKLFRNFTKREELLDTLIFSIERDNLGNLYFATSSGVNKLSYLKRKIDKPDDENRTILYFENLTTKEGLINNYVRKILRDNIGNIWFLTPKGLSKLDPSASQSLGRNVINNYFFEKDISTGTIKTPFTQDSRGNFWLGTDGQGIYRLGIDDTTHKCSILETINTENGLSSDYIWSLFEDREANLWIGTDGGGISKYLGKMFESFTEKQGLADNTIFDIYQDNKNRFWFGTYNDGISMLDMTKPGTIKEKITNFNIATGFPDNSTHKIIQDSEGMMWSVTDIGAIRWDPDQKQQKYSIIKLSDTLSGKRTRYNHTTCILEDSKGNIWLGSMYMGVFKAVKDANEPNGYKLINYNKSEGLIYFSVWDLLEDSEGSIWVSTREGISKIIKGIDSGKYPVIQNYTKNEGLIHNGVIAIFQDSKKNMWFGTEGGLSKLILNKEEGYDPKSEKALFKNFTTDDGLSSDLIYLINMDNDGNLWFGTNKGIDQYNINRGTFKNYGLEEGFSGVETNGGATFKDKEGNLWFGTIKGAIKFNPSELKFNNEEPITQILKLRVFFKDILLPLDNVFKHDQNYLTFDFIAVSLKVPEKVRYQWKLEGFDDDWLPETKETRVTYSNIPPGEYIFKVKACNNDGLWNEKPAMFYFNITPPFWRTWWFYSLCVITLVISIFTFIKVRERKLLKEKMILEQKVTERTRDLAEANLQLADKNKKITQSINYAKRLQRAILPPGDLVKKYLPESFILYKPKDIVSGDFYWLDVKKNKILIAAVDCTGHGVPGAMMSIVGYNLLNQSLNKNGHSEPSEILHYLNDGLSNIFKTGYEESNVKDGMDIALCSIDFDEMKLQFAGAYNPLYLIRDNQLVVKNGNKYPIGYYVSWVKKDFITHKIDIQKGDALYIFSDGYADQFGGPNDRKFYRTQFQKLLLKIHTLPMEEQQQQLDKVITDWMGKHKQLDDMLVIGIRV